REAAFLPCDHRMAARDGDVVEEDVAVGGPAHGGALALELEDLSGAAAARPDDERRPLHAFHARARLLCEALGRVAERRLRLAWLALEHRAATGAVVRGLRVLEAAFGA